MSIIAERLSYAMTIMQIIKEVSSGTKSSYLETQGNKQANIYPSNLPTSYFSPINNYVSSNNNFFNNYLGNYNQINQVAQSASQQSSTSVYGCVCVASSTEKSGISQGSSNRNSALENVKKTASNVWGGIKNFFGRIF